MRCAGMAVMGALALMIAACGGSTSPALPSIAGVYHLQTIDHTQLPFITIQNTQGSVAIEADTLTILDGGTWSEFTTLQVTNNGQTAAQTSSDNGTWARANPPFIILTSNATHLARYQGTVGANELDLADTTYGYVFTK